MKTSPTKVLRGHYGSMTFVAFHSGDQIISASNDETIRRFCVSNERNEVLREGVAFAVAVSPNKRWVAAGGRDGRVRLLDLEAPTKVLKSDARHASAIKSLAFSPDSSELASGAHDGTILLWSTATVKTIAEPFGGYKDAVWCVCYSPDGRKIASCDREIVKIWETATRIGLTIGELAWSLAWSSDGSALFVGCIDGTIKRYNPDTGELYNWCKQHSDVVSSIILSHNANFIATASWDKTVRFFEVVTFQQIGPALKHDTQVHSISISPDDSFIVSGARDSNIRIWNLRTIAPTLFRHLPLDPVRGQITKGGHLPWPTSARSEFSYDPSDSRSIASHGQISIQGSDGSLESGDSRSTKSRRSTRSRFGFGIMMNPFSPTRRRGGTHGGPGAHHPPSAQTDSRSLHTDNMSAASVSSHYSEDAPLSPGGSVSSPYSPILPSQAENWNFIREIRTHDLSGKIIAEGTRPVISGSHYNIYSGTLYMNCKSMRVAIKAMKLNMAEDDHSNQRRLHREIKLWLKLEHANVIPLLGTTKGYGDFPAMVCPWVENDQLTSYLASHDNNLTAQHRWHIIDDVALGLQYLHSQSVIHGDISGANILVYSSGRACISDFSIATDGEERSLVSTYQVKGTICWTAPELIAIRESQDERELFLTPQSDIYSFGGIVLLVLSGKPPYYHLSRDQQVIAAISKGEYPRRPSVVTDFQWAFMKWCWSFVAADRPRPSHMVRFAHEQLLGACNDIGSVENHIVRDASR